MKKLTKVITKKSKKEKSKVNAVDDLIDSLMGLDRPPSKNPSPEEIQNQKKKEAKKNLFKLGIKEFI